MLSLTLMPDMRRGNLSIFISLQGCPYQCIYCDQRRISGQDEMTPQKANRILEREIPSWTDRGIRGQIAFFGGTFTGLPPADMRAYLMAVQPYLQNGAVNGIRISTRPDCIDQTVLDLLAYYGVTHIELGVQSLDDDVLRASGRGYTVEDVGKSASLILRAGFTLGMQMMPGLPNDDDEKSIETAKKIIAMGAAETRIYPTIVIRGTALEKIYRFGKYIPLSLERAVDLTAKLKDLFERNGVTVLKVGLHSGTVEDSIVAGPYHPAFGQLVNSKMCLDKLVDFAVKNNLRDDVLAVVPDRFDPSDIIGQKRSNFQYMQERFGIFLKISKKELTNRELSIIL